MKKSPCYLVLSVSAILLLQVAPLSAKANFESHAPVSSGYRSNNLPLIRADDLRHTIVHDAGNFYTSITDAVIALPMSTDPETGAYLHYTTYPKGSQKMYVYMGSIWIGGIVDEDTLVTAGVDGWFNAYELPAENFELGSSFRTGQFADDEFLAVLADTGSRIDSPSEHIPLGIEVEQKSSSWADTLYDDFVILEYIIRNVGINDVRDGWIGFYFDNDIYHASDQYSGWQDDLSGFLDTLLYDNDSTSRISVAYSYDNDGDPSPGGDWDSTSVRGMISLFLLGSSFPIENTNFNYWFSNGNPALDWGPRRLGTPEDPLRVFSHGGLGTPVLDPEKYYVMSHSEIDYNQIEAAIHDSSDGWIPSSTAPNDLADGWDTRFLYSFGAFDLRPGDSISFIMAIVAAEGLHVDPGDWTNVFDPLFPELFQDTLDFSELMISCRRADSVYRSGYILPQPGPPAGLEIVDYNDSYVTLTWHGSSRPDLSGYFLHLMDTTYGNQWNKVSDLLVDTIGTITIYEPAHVYFVGVSLQDTQGRESAVSHPVSVVPGRPHPPENLTIILDDLIPEISWLPDDDTTMQGFLIYRAVWEEPFELYDSTVSLSYHDYGTESGVRYSYKVSATNALNLESELVGPVIVLPMAMDQGILYCDLNRFESSNPPPYQEQYMKNLFESVASITPTDIAKRDDREITFKQMSDYSLIISDEAGVPRSWPILEDSVINYLQGGGKVVFIKPTFDNIASFPKKQIYGDGTFYHDFLKLDSAVINALVFDGTRVIGDLYACSTLSPDYPRLEADTAKLAASGLPINEYIPLAGYMYPAYDAEPIYSYISSNPDTSHHGSVNGIRYLGEDYSFVLLSFPLMAMKEQSNIYALRQALIDLNVDMNCGDADDDGEVTIGDIIVLVAYLYRGGPEPASAGHADIDCSGDIDPADVIGLINFIFRYGWIECCP